MLGLPKLIKEEDVHAEFPSDADDEYVTEKGFQPSLPGEATRLSSALALFRCSRILGKVLEKIYPSSTSHELSLQQMSALATELDEWYEKLPQHLRLNFKQDKPSTDVTGSRSPILVSGYASQAPGFTSLTWSQALAYYYTRTLIYRPAVTSSLGPKAAPALISVGESSKHIIQIIQLLDERSMSFSFCLNKSDTLILCGMALLYQTMGLKQDSKVLKDNERLVNAVIKVVEKAKAPGSYDFKRVAGLLVTVDEPAPQSLPTPPGQSPDVGLTGPAMHRASSTTLHKIQSTLGRHSSASISETDLLLQQEKLRRMAMQHAQPGRPEQYPARSRGSFDSSRPTVPLAQRDHRLSLTHAQAAQAAMIARVSTSPTVPAKQNIDYHYSQSQSQPSSPVEGRSGLQQRPPPGPQQQQSQLYAQLQKGASLSTAEWEAILSSIEGGQINVYDAMYGGPGLTALGVDNGGIDTTVANAAAAWSPDSWDLAGFNLGDFGPGSDSVPASAHSVLSMSEDGLSSSDDLISVGSMDFGGVGGGLLPVTAPEGGGFVLEGFGL
jgi:hypothetical protein